MAPMPLPERLEAALKEFESLPHEVTWLLDLMQDSTIGIAPLIEKIKNDPALSKFLLGLCSSPYYARGRNITTLEDALIFLGNRKLAQIAVTIELGRMMRTRITFFDYQRSDLWRHSLGVGYGASLLITGTGETELKEMAFTAGFLHDIGRLVVAFSLKKHKRSKISLPENTSLILAEKLVAGFDHSQAGAALAAAWGLPEEIGYAIRFHHRPDDIPGGNLLASSIHIADRYYNLLDKRPIGHLQEFKPPDEDVFTRFTGENLADLAENLMPETDRLVRMTRGLI